MLETVKTIAEVGKATHDVVMNSKTLKAHALRTLRLIKRRGNINLPIFGSGGVGKTTLGRLLQGENIYFLSETYQESPSNEEFKLVGGVPCVLLVGVGQGQSLRADILWQELFEKIESVKDKIIINVVAAGFHSFDLRSYSESKLYEKGMDASAFVEKHREAMMLREIEMLDKMIKGIEVGGGKLILITVITKLDLWWNEFEAVKNHYISGDYAKKTEDLKGKVKSANFQHEVMEVSLTIGQFKTKNEVLVNNKAGYGLEEHHFYTHLLYKKLCQILEKNL